MRLSRIDGCDLTLFDFDFDLTFMVFFLNADEQVYARYGGRDPQSADARQSLAGLRHAMESVLKVHGQEQPEYIARRELNPKRVSDIANRSPGGGCTHCHQVKEGLNNDLRAAGQWSVDRIWRFPLPDNLGLIFDVDAGSRVESIVADSPAERAGIKPGETIARLDDTPVRTFGDAQFVLDRLPSQGRTTALVESNGESRKVALELPAGWRRTPIGWRRSLAEQIPTARFKGDDLSDEEKRTLGLPAAKMAFRQSEPLGPAETGVHAGDIVLDVDDRGLELPGMKLRAYVAKHYVCGERIRVRVLREGQPHEASLALEH